MKKTILFVSLFSIIALANDTKNDFFEQLDQLLEQEQYNIWKEQETNIFLAERFIGKKEYTESDKEHIDNLLDGSNARRKIILLEEFKTYKDSCRINESNYREKLKLFMVERIDSISQWKDLAWLTKQSKKEKKSYSMLKKREEEKAIKTIKEFSTSIEAIFSQCNNNTNNSCKVLPNEKEKKRIKRIMVMGFSLDPQMVPDLTKCTNLSGLNLSKLDLSNLDLSDTNFEDSELNKTNLQNSNISGCKFNRANCTETDFYQAEGLSDFNTDKTDIILDGATWPNGHQFPNKK